MPPIVKTGFVDPAVAKSPLEPTEPKPATPTLNLGPSAPHFDDDPSLEELQALLPGSPPTLVGAYNDKHYTEVLDPLWMEFDQPEERTAGRFLAMIDEVADEALRMHQLSMDFWDRTPEIKVPKSERERFQKEFLDYLRRIKGYKQRLLDLPDDSQDTDEVYLGLIKRRDGAGPVPDAIMHLYFANQIGVLSEHAHEMGKGYVGRVMTALDKAGSASREATDLIGDKSGKGSAVLDQFFDRLGMLITAGVAVVVVGGVATTAGVILWRSKRATR